MFFPHDRSMETGGLTDGAVRALRVDLSRDVSLFYRIADFTAKLFGKYGAFIEKAHHSRKKDAPDGYCDKKNRRVDEGEDYLR